MKSTEPTPHFDVITVRPHKDDGRRDGSFGWKGLFFSTDNAPIKFLIANAFHVKMWLITGLPAWAETSNWNVQAKVVEEDAALMQNLTRDQRSAMLRTILEERFGMVWHMEAKAQPVYELTVLPGGPRFHATPVPSTAGGGDAARKRQSGWTINHGLAKANGITLPQLAEGLSSELERSVVDKTGLNEMYDLELHWTPEDGPKASDNGVAGDALPDIFTALKEQLGMKPSPAREAVPVLVIDHMQPPADN
ncbi:MAG: TIGR03435 family protein [Janthinobacterium lividum]